VGFSWDKAKLPWRDLASAEPRKVGKPLILIHLS